MLAGIAFTLLPGVFQTYLPAAWGNVPTLLFGLGAVMVATNPDGVVAVTARQVQELVARVAARRSRGAGTGPPGPARARSLSVRVPGFAGRQASERRDPRGGRSPACSART